MAQRNTEPSRTGIGKLGYWEACYMKQEKKTVQAPLLQGTTNRERWMMIGRSLCMVVGGRTYIPSFVGCVRWCYKNNDITCTLSSRYGQHFHQELPARDKELQIELSGHNLNSTVFTSGCSSVAFSLFLRLPFLLVNDERVVGKVLPFWQCAEKR